MYEYRCRVIKVVDGDTIDVDIDLGFNITCLISALDYKVSILQNRAQETWKKKSLGYLRKKLLSPIAP